MGSTWRSWEACPAVPQHRFVRSLAPETVLAEMNFQQLEIHVEHTQSSLAEAVATVLEWWLAPNHALASARSEAAILVC